MGRWDKSNNLEYKGVNFGRRDLIEVMSYENAYCILEYMKYKYDVKKVKKTEAIICNLIPFFVYVHEVLNDKAFSEISEKDAEQFIYYACGDVWTLNARICSNKITNFYNYLLYINKATENPFKKLAILYKKESRKYFFLKQEQIDKIKNIQSDYLKLYFNFTLSTGATSKQIRYLKWSDIDFSKRIVLIGKETLYFNKDVLNLLERERYYRISEELVDCGYVFRSHIKDNYNKDIPISMSTLSNWCTQIGQYIDVPNLKHNHIRHTAIQQLLSVSGSVGMTSMLMNYPYLTSQARYFVNGDSNNSLLQEYKDICEI